MKPAAAPKMPPHPTGASTFAILSACRSLLPKKLILEIEVKSRQKFADVQVGAIQAKSRTGTILMPPVVFVVPGKTCAACHERVVTHRECVCSDVTQALLGPRGGLLLHPDGLKAANEDELRTIDVVRLKQNTVPDG